jgi:hypothetical protein
VSERHAGGQQDHRRYELLGHCMGLVKRRAQFGILGFGVAAAS